MTDMNMKPLTVRLAYNGTMEQDRQQILTSEEVAHEVLSESIPE